MAISTNIILFWANQISLAYATTIFLKSESISLCIIRNQIGYGNWNLQLRLGEWRGLEVEEVVSLEGWVGRRVCWASKRYTVSSAYHRLTDADGHEFYDNDLIANSHIL